MFRRKERSDRGWHGERERHAKAAKGIKTGRKNVFKKQTDIPYYDILLKNPDYSKKSGVSLKYMRPRKYLHESKKINKSQGLLTSKPDPGVLDNYTSQVESGKRMPLPYLDYNHGKHAPTSNVMVAKKLKNKKVPVLVVKRNKYGTI